MAGPVLQLWSSERDFALPDSRLHSYHLADTNEVASTCASKSMTAFVAPKCYDRSMSNASEVIARVSRLAVGQWGMLTTAQAERAGISRLRLARLVEAGVLERVDRGIYATTSSPDEHRTLRAAWLALDPVRTAEERLVDPIASGVVSHTSAAGLHQLGDLLDDQPEFTLPQRKQSRRGIRLHRRVLAVDEVTLVAGLPTTTGERTAADLLRDGHDPEHVAQIVGEGVRRGVIDVEDLAAQLEPFARSHGQPNGTALVGYLLDVVGLSPRALAHELSQTAAGQDLVAVGRAAAFNELLESLVPTFARFVPSLAPPVGRDMPIAPEVLRSPDDLETTASVQRVVEAMRVLAEAGLPAVAQGNPEEAA